MSLRGGENVKKLIIDAGHGGSDPGATAHGYLEKDLNLIIAKRVRTLLKEYNPAMTRETDITVESNKRSLELVKDKYEYCLSIHLNAFKGTSTGIETIHSIHSENGKKLAECIADALNKETGLSIKKIFSRSTDSGNDYYYMHRNTGKTITVIVEGLYLDNEHDLKYLNVEKISQGIAKGFKNFIESGEEILIITKVLRYGMKDEEVKILQEKLKTEGYYAGSIDGSFGPATLKAVKAFQGRNSLDADGIVGPLTREVINGVKKN